MAAELMLGDGLKRLQGRNSTFDVGDAQGILGGHEGFRGCSSI
jgi:hypothetical protein